MDDINFYNQRMMEKMSEEDKIRAMQNFVPRPREKRELGGGIYYKCYWSSCGETVSKYDNFCKKCGQRFTEEY